MSRSQELRKRILSKREAVFPGERLEKSNRIKQTLLTLDLVRASRVVFCYVDFISEVETQSLITDLLQQKKTVAVPLTRVKEKQLIPVSISSVEKDLQPGYCDIPEPGTDVTAKNRIDPQTIDIIILPGSVFDEHGGRMGYGGGYYDRFVSNLAPQAIRIGLCFDLQLQKKIPLEPHDEMMDYIVTETRIIDTNRQHAEEKR